MPAALSPAAKNTKEGLPLVLVCIVKVLLPLAPDRVVSALTDKVELKVAAPVTAKVPENEAAAVDKDKEESLPNPSVSFFSDPVSGPLSVTLIRLSYVSCGVVPVKVVPILIPSC